MICLKCGIENPDVARFCKNCGAQMPVAAQAPPPPPAPPQPAYTPAPPEARTYTPPAATTAPPASEGASGMAITALILGIVSLCCGCLLGIPASIIGFLELGKIKRGESSPKGKGFAMAGVIMGIVSIILTVVGLIFYFVVGIANFR